METKNKYAKYKYRILEILQTNFSIDKSRELKEEIPTVLNCSKKTFINWVYLKQDNPATISYEDLFVLAKLLNTTIENLLNFEITYTEIKPKN